MVIITDSLESRERSLMNQDKYGLSRHSLVHSTAIQEEMNEVGP